MEEVQLALDTPQSSNVKRVEYLGATNQVLIVTFKNDSAWEYFNVIPEEAKQVMFPEAIDEYSVGKAFYRIIKGKKQGRPYGG